MIAVDRWLTPMLSRLKECMCTELANSPGGPVARSGLIWSDLPVTDGCQCPCVAGQNGDACECPPGSSGRAYIRLTDGESTVFPGQAEPCPRLGWYDIVRLGVFRCTIGCAPELRGDEAEETMFRIAQGDKLALRRAVRCCAKQMPVNGVELFERSWQTIGPEGCCYGGELVVWARVP